MKHYLTTMIGVLKMSIKILMMETTNFIDLMMNKIVIIVIVIIALFLFCFHTFEYNKVFMC